MNLNTNTLKLVSYEKDIINKNTIIVGCEENTKYFIGYIFQQRDKELNGKEKKNLFQSLIVKNEKKKIFKKLNIF